MNQILPLSAAVPSDRGVSPVRPRTWSRSLVFYAAGLAFGLLASGVTLFTAKGSRIRSFPAEDAALVSGQPILRSDLRAQVELESGGTFNQASPVRRRQVLEEMINEELLVQRGLDVGLPTTDPEVRAALVNGVNLQVDADILSEQPTDAELRAFYLQHLDHYATDGEMAVRDLMFKGARSANATQTMAAADSLRAAIGAGLPLSAVVARYGLQDSGAIGPDLTFDFAVKAKLGDGIYNSIRGLHAGQISPPIQRPDGIHLVAVLLRTPPVQRDFEMAQDDVWSDYKVAARADVERANLKYLRSRADITLSPELAP